MDVNSRSPLHWAASHGNYDQAKQLVKAGADISLRDVEGKTPLHWAAATDTNNSVKLVQLLVGSHPRKVVSPPPANNGMFLCLFLS